MASYYVDSDNGQHSYKPIGIETVCPLTGKKFYKPDVDSSIKPFVNQEFNSFDEAYSFYSTYAAAGGFTVRKNTRYTSHGVVKLRYYVCSKEGFKPAKKSYDTLQSDDSKKQSRNCPSQRTGCGAFIRVELTPDQKKYRIYAFVEEHNHCFVNERDMHLLPSVRKMTYTQESIIHDLGAINLGPARAFSVLRTIFGGFENIGITKSDCNNFKKELNAYIGEYDAEMVVSRLMRKQDYLPNFSCDYITDEDGSLKGLFWADEQAKRNFFIFSDVISFDATYKSNKYKMVLVPFTGIDNHNRNVLLGCSLLSNETAESYSWLLRAFLKAFGKEPLVVVTDQDPAIKKAITEVFVSARHRLCMWHIMENVNSKVFFCLGPQLCSSTDFRRRMCDIVWTDGILPSEFEFEWQKLLDDFGLNDHNWMSDIHNIRKDWIPAYYREEKLSGLMRTSSHSESENHFFSQFRNPRCTLVEFLSHYDTAVEIQRYEHQKNDHETRYKIPDIWSDFVLEKQASELYTRTIFLDVQMEIDYAINKCASIEVVVVNDFTRFKIVDFTQTKSPSLEVLFRKEDMCIQCSCLRYEQFGLLCRHIFYVLRLCDIREFPKKYILRRWTREAVPNLPNKSILSGECSSGSSSDVDSVVREIRLSTEYVINRLVTDMDKLCSFRDQMKDAMILSDESQVRAPLPSRTDRLATLTGLTQPERPNIRVPIQSKTKGSGTHTRYKSAREKAISQTGKSPRHCKICKLAGHDTRNHAKFVAEQQSSQSNHTQHGPVQQ